MVASHLATLVAFHGLTDAVQHGHGNLAYAATLIPFQGQWTLFGACSVFHLSQDFGGFSGSMGLHLAALTMARFRSITFAMNFMLASLSFWHVPRHYSRVFRTSPRAAVAVGTSALVLTPVLAPLVPVFTMEPWMARLVIVHVLLNSPVNRWSGSEEE